MRQGTLSVPMWLVRECVVFPTFLVRVWVYLCRLQFHHLFFLKKGSFSFSSPWIRILFLAHAFGFALEAFLSIFASSRRMN